MNSSRSRSSGKSTAPRMVDVARLAGVSTATVSRTLAGSPVLNAELAERVRSAIRELGYTPNAVARSLRMQETRAVIVIVPDISNAFFSMLLRGVEEQANATGYSVLIGNAANDPEREAKYAQHVMAKRADGLILINGRLPDLGTAASAGQVPMVVVSEWIAGSGLPTVRTDDVESARGAVSHLLDLGHRDIACIAGKEDSVLTLDRVQGYRQALAAAGLRVREDWVTHGAFTIASGADAMTELLRHDRTPTAVFACNDEMAIGAMQSAKNHGLSVPRDLSIVGFDDIPFAASYDTPLTTVSQPFVDIGKAAMTMLGEVLARGKAAEDLIVLQSQLTVRESTAPPLTR